MKRNLKYFLFTAFAFATGVFVFQNCARLQYDDQTQDKFFTFQATPNNQLGPLSILGITSPNETQVDSFLIGSDIPIVHWTESVGATEYTVTIRNGSSTVCAERTGAVTVFRMSKCQLTFGDYEVVVTASADSRTQSSDPFPVKYDANAVRLIIQAPTIHLHDIQVPYTVENPASLGSLRCHLSGPQDFATTPVDCTNKTAQSFVNLSYGPYVFQVEMTDKDGHVSTRERSFDVLAPVCDPLAPNKPSATDPVCEQRVKANVYFHTDLSGNPQWNSVDQYIHDGIKSGTIYFSNVFIPTRSFISGFPGITDRTEFFAFDMLTRLKTSANLGPGNYQFALIADDGAKLSYFNSENAETQIIDNDGYHPTRLITSTVPVVLTAKDKILFRIRYFQGPRDAISLVLMYRNWNALAVNTVISGYTSQDFFGSFPVPAKGQTSFPGTTYDQMIKDGWKPVPVESFENPDI